MANTTDKSMLRLNKSYSSNPAFLRLKERASMVRGIGPVPCRIAIVGGAPSNRDSIDHQPFSGKPGALLERLLRQYSNIDIEQCYLTYVLKYRPWADRAPTDAEKKESRRYLAKELAVVAPEIVVLSGELACQAVFKSKVDQSIDHGVPIKNKSRVYFPVHSMSEGISHDELENLRKDFAKLMRINISL